MGLFDALDGSAYSQANRRNQYAIATGLQQGGNALQSSAQAGLGYLLGTPNSAGSLQYLDTGYTQAQGALGSAYGQTRDTLSGLQALYQPLVDQGGAAEARFLNASGANGAAGSAQAAQDFVASPGYQYALDQSTGAVQRSAASRGGLAGGNATVGILGAANGLASQGYQQYVDNLRNASGLYTQGIQGQAAGLGALANASQNYGNASAGLDTNRGSALSSIMGQAAGVQQQLGQGTANLVSNATNALTASNNQQAQGQTQASSNALGALFGGVGLAANGVGRSGGLGSLGSGLLSLAGINPFGGL